MYVIVAKFNFFTCVGLVPTDVSESSLTVTSNCSSGKQQNIVVVSQPISLVSIVSDTNTSTSPITTISIVECLTTSSSVVTSISGQNVSTITTEGVDISIYCVAKYMYKQTWWMLLSQSISCYNTKIIITYLVNSICIYYLWTHNALYKCLHAYLIKYFNIWYTLTGLALAKQCWVCILSVTYRCECIACKVH